MGETDHYLKMKGIVFQWCLLFWGTVASKKNKLRKLQKKNSKTYPTKYWLEAIIFDEARKYHMSVYNNIYLLRKFLKWAL